MRPRRVAIAGAGPKGLFALERLLHHCAEDGGPELDVHVFDPDPDPGAGAVYRPSQPPYLAMNQPAGNVDMWWPGGGAVPAAQRLPLAAWSGRDPGEYAPRAEVGRYLRHGLDLILRHAPADARVQLHREAVTHVEPALGAGWHVHTATGPGTYDEVLLATGHEPAAPVNGFPVFPVEGLSERAIPDGSVVAIRGFALSFIDAALALTEGRGGRFVPGDRPHRLRFLPGPRAPVELHPYSRSGRPILPKPEARVADIPGLDRVEQRGRERLDAAAPPCDLEAQILPALASTAAACLGLVSPDADPGWARAWVEAAASGSAMPEDGDPRTRLEHALDVAVGAAGPDRDWALGHAWRALYPAIVRATGSEALDPAGRPAFLRLAAQMERIAFGPAPRNTAKVLALIDAGVVQLGGGPLDRADVMVDAVLAPPGVPAGGPLRELVDAGHACLVPGGRGLSVDAQGTCIAGDGGSSTGLAAYGRPTEDGVVGNDTLSRTLHPFIDRWAARVARPAPGPVAAPLRDLAVRA